MPGPSGLAVKIGAVQQLLRYEGRTRRNPIVKVAVGRVAVAVLGYLFATTLSDVSSEPYYVRMAELRQWTIDVDGRRDPNAPVLLLRPPQELPMSLFDQVFQRTMESYTTPALPGIPLVLPRYAVPSPLMTGVVSRLPPVSICQSVSPLFRSTP